MQFLFKYDNAAHSSSIDRMLDEPMFEHKGHFVFMLNGVVSVYSFTLAPKQISAVKGRF
jgi:hypothetical protein